MDLTTELEKLKTRKQKLEIRKEKLATTLEAKQAARDKLLAKLEEKNIDPDDLPDMIASAEAEVQALLTQFSADLDTCEEKLEQVETALAASEDP